MTPQSPDLQAQLAQLRDIHLPAPVGWWPPAPGWWALLGVALLVVLAALALIRRRRRSVRRAALGELAALRARATTEADAPDVAADLAVLLRRVALTGPEARRMAALSGPKWITELERRPHGLSQPVAAYLANAPYAPSGSDGDSVQLNRALDEARKWIRRHA